MKKFKYNIQSLGWVDNGLGLCNEIWLLNVFILSASWNLIGKPICCTINWHMLATALSTHLSKGICFVLRNVRIEGNAEVFEHTNCICQQCANEAIVFPCVRTHSMCIRWMSLSWHLCAGCLCGKNAVDCVARSFGEGNFSHDAPAQLANCLGKCALSVPRGGR